MYVVFLERWYSITYGMWKRT